MCICIIRVFFTSSLKNKKFPLSRAYDFVPIKLRSKEEAAPPPAVVVVVGGAKCIGGGGGGGCILLVVVIVSQNAG